MNKYKSAEGEICNERYYKLPFLSYAFISYI